jgi:hypothetical protein
MVRKQTEDNESGPNQEDRPAEINMTDLEAADRLGKRTGRRPPQSAAGDIHAAGTPGGGTAAGGLAGTNIGHGEPDDADLEDALGSGIYDNEED